MRIVTCISVMLLALMQFALAQEGQIRGKIIDRETGELLIGANVVVEGTEIGSATDQEGVYNVTNLAPGTYTLVVSYIGYSELKRPGITVAAGQTVTLDLALEPTGVGLNAVTISASRRPEKTLEAPASVSILDAKEIRTEVAPSSVSALRNVTGVDISQTGVDRREVVLRGFNNAFSGAAYILTDYRQAAVPALAVNIHSIMPNMVEDISRVEVVRGPGSALYGAGVDAGVIHYLTKDPFTWPGTSVSLGGGERSSIFGAFRHAGIISEHVGYKITGQYAQADDWKLDPNDPQDADQLQNDVRARNYDYVKANINALLQFRLGNDVTLTANGGWSGLDATVLSGIGTVQADGFGYSYGQLRLQAGKFFAQAYINQNDAGDSFVYGTGTTVVDKGRQINVQAQHEFEFANGRQNLIVGADLDNTRPETEGTIYGRNDGKNTIYEWGGYVQSLTRLSPVFDLTLAIRGDYDNIIETLQISPRVALVYKAAPTHSFRAAYNRAFTLPSNNSFWLDIVAAQVGPITVRGRGSKDGHQFTRNPALAPIYGSDLVARSLNPATPGAPQGVGLPLDAVYAGVYAQLAALPNLQLRQLIDGALLETDPNTGEFIVPDALIDVVKNLLAPGSTNVTGVSKGQLIIPSLTGGPSKFVSDAVDIEPLKHTITQTVELGYKGLINNKFLLAVDGYYAKKNDFIGPLLLESPMVITPALTGDFQAALEAGITSNEALATLLAVAGFTPGQVAESITAVAAQQSAAFQGSPVAIVVSKQNDLGEGQIPELMLAYRNFGNIEYWGTDLAMEFFATDRLKLFANASIVSDDFFDNKELKETNTDLALALNAPKYKTKLGFGYNVPEGIAFGASWRWINGFPVLSGPYEGDVPSYNLVDVNVGYDLNEVARGVRFDFVVQNLLDNKHREFIGAPKIGRMAMARLNWTF